MMPAFLASLLMQSSLSPILRMAPQMAEVVKPPVMRPVDSSTEARLIWIEAWSLADKILLDALHFLGMYMSTYSPASFCMVQVGFSSLLRSVFKLCKLWTC